MINLVNYYKTNVQNNEYYYRFYKDLVTRLEQEENELIELGWLDESYRDNTLFEVYDLEEAIKRFRDLCEPNLDMSSDKNNIMCFYLVSFYLNKNGYCIEEFPHLLERPPIELTNFTIDDIRNKALELKLDDNGSVPYRIRRRIVAGLHFSKKNNGIEIDENINELFEKISTRSARFQEMTEDEKLKEIANLIENMLIEKNEYKKLEYNKVCFEYINDDFIKEYRKQIQCFRHAKGTSLEERKKFSTNQKLFLIDYGIIIIKIIYELLRQK